MKIGMMNRPRHDVVDEIAWMRENDFDFIDLTLSAPAADPHDLETAAIRTALDEHGIGVVAQAPRYIPVGSPLKKIRRAARDELRHCLNVAHELGSETLSTHFSFYEGMFSVDDIVSWHEEILSPLCEEAKAAGVTLLLENASDAGHHQFNFIVNIMDRIPELGFHLCSGHAKLEFANDLYSEYVSRLASRIQHVQLSENDGSGDQHLPLGASLGGPVNWADRIQQLRKSGFDRTITLKIFSPEPEYVLLSRALLKRWWGNE